MFFTPHGNAIIAAPPMPTADLAALDHRNRERGIELNWGTGLPPAA